MESELKKKKEIKTCIFVDDWRLFQEKKNMLLGEMSYKWLLGTLATKIELVPIWKAIAEDNGLACGVIMPAPTSLSFSHLFHNHNSHIP